MLSAMKHPKTKSELIRSVQQLYNPKFVVLEITGKDQIKDVTKSANDLVKKGPISIILISDP